MKTPKNIMSLELINDCTNTSITEWESFIENTTKACGKTIRKLIKKHIPDLYENLQLEFPNPFESNSVKKKGLLVYVHSGIEYFLKYN